MHFTYRTLTLFGAFLYTVNICSAAAISTITFAIEFDDTSSTPLSLPSSTIIPFSTPQTTQTPTDTDTLAVFLNLISSIPDSNLVTEDGTKEFFMKIRNCLSGTLQGVFISNLPKINSLTSQFGEFTSVLAAGGNAINFLESKVTSALPALATKASAALGGAESVIASKVSELPVHASAIENDIKSHITEALPQITSAIGNDISKIVPVVTSVLGNVGGFLGGLFGKRDLNSAVRCLGIAAQTTELFKVGTCVVGLAAKGKGEDLANIKAIVVKSGGVESAAQNVNVLGAINQLGQDVEECAGLSTTSNLA